MLTRQSELSYQCNGCLQCCKNCTVILNPYDVLRLADALEVPTGVFINEFVDAADWTLKHKANGGCMLLGETTCGVYSDRPLPCRLYPFARMSSMDGTEQFATLEPEPDSAGRYGKTATVNDYLQRQNLDEHIFYADKYLALFGQLLRRLHQEASDSQRIRDMVLDHLCVQHQLLSDESRRALIGPLLDGDKLVEDYCTKNNLKPPKDLQGKAELQLCAAEQLLNRDFCID